MIAYKPWRRCSIDYSSQSWISLKNIKFPWGHPFRYNRESTKLPSPTIRKSAGYFDLNIMPHSYHYSIYHAKNDFLCHSPHQTNLVKLSQWRILVSFPTSKLFLLKTPSVRFLTSYQSPTSAMHFPHWAYWWCTGSSVIWLSRLSQE